MNAGRHLNLPRVYLLNAVEKNSKRKSIFTSGRYELINWQHNVPYIRALVKDSVDQILMKWKEID